MNVTRGGPASGEAFLAVADPAGEPEIDLAGLTLLSDKGGEGALPPFVEFERACFGMKLLAVNWEAVLSPKDAVELRFDSDN